MGIHDSRAILIGGCFRSGTSLVRRILNAHSRIHCGPEVKFLRDFYGDYFDDPLAHLRFFRSARALASDDELLEIAGRSFVELHERAAVRAGKARWADKNPENVLYIDAWTRLLGDAFSFVHVVRSPLATLASMRAARFPLTLPASLDDRIAVYRRYNEAGLAIAERFPDRCLRVSYEALVCAPRATIGHLMRWLGEEAEDRQLAFNSVPQGEGLEDPKIATTDAIHTDSLERWRELLDSTESAAITRQTADLWARLAPASRAAA